MASNQSWNSTSSHFLLCALAFWIVCRMKCVSNICLNTNSSGKKHSSFFCVLAASVSAQKQSQRDTLAQIYPVHVLPVAYIWKTVDFCIVCIQSVRTHTLSLLNLTQLSTHTQAHCQMGTRAYPHRHRHRHTDTHTRLSEWKHSFFTVDILLSKKTRNHPNYVVSCVREHNWILSIGWCLCGSESALVSHFVSSFPS